jgi:hypothetical protein
MDHHSARSVDVAIYHFLLSVGSSFNYTYGGQAFSERTRRIKTNGTNRDLSRFVDVAPLPIDPHGCQSFAKSDEVLPGEMRCDDYVAGAVDESIPLIPDDGKKLWSWFPLRRL